MYTTDPPMIEPRRWYTLREASAVLPLTPVMLRLRMRRGLIAHQRVEPLTPGGRPTFKIQGSEVLRLLGSAAVAEQPKPKQVDTFAEREKAALQRIGLAKKS